MKRARRIDRLNAGRIQGLHQTIDELREQNRHLRRENRDLRRRAERSEDQLGTAGLHRYLGVEERSHG